MYDRNLYSLLDFFDDFSNKWNNFFDNFLNLLDSILIDYSFLNDFDLFDSGNFHSYLNYLLYNPFNLFYLFNRLNNRNNFFNNSLNNLRNLFNMINNFSSRFVLNSIHKFLYYLFHLNYDRFFDNPFNYFLNNPLNLFDSLNDLLYYNGLLSNDFNFLVLWYRMIHYLFNYNRFFDLDNTLFDNLNFNNFWNFYSLFNNFFNNFWYFHNFLFNTFHLYNFLNNPVNILNYFNRNMNYLLDLLDFSILNHFLY